MATIDDLRAVDAEITVAAPEADGRPWVLEEVEPEPGQQRYVVRLAGSAGPSQGAQIETTARLVRRVYPGMGGGGRQPRVTTKVMGLDHAPITLTGVLRDDLLGGQNAARETYRRLRELQARQKPCDLRWGGVVGVRGHIERVRVSLMREGYLRYELTFSVDQNLYEPVEKAVTRFDRALPAQLVRSLAAELAARAGQAAATAAGATATIGGALAPRES